MVVVVAGVYRYISAKLEKNELKEKVNAESCSEMYIIAICIFLLNIYELADYI